MKRRDVIVITVSVIIFVFAAGLIYRYFAPPTADKSVQLTVPRKVNPVFSQSDIQELTNPALKDYTPDITPNFSDKQNLF